MPSKGQWCQKDRGSREVGSGKEGVEERRAFQAKGTKRTGIARYKRCDVGRGWSVKYKTVRGNEVGEREAQSWRPLCAIPESWEYVSQALRGH